MAVGKQVTVGTSATKLNASDAIAGSAVLRNRGGASVFLGGADVDDTGANAGVELAAADGFVTVPISGDALYGVAAAGTVRVDVLECG